MVINNELFQTLQISFIPSKYQLLLTANIIENFDERLGACLATKECYFAKISINIQFLSK